MILFCFSHPSFFSFASIWSFLCLSIDVDHHILLPVSFFALV